MKWSEYSFSRIAKWERYGSGARTLASAGIWRRKAAFQVRFGSPAVQLAIVIAMSRAGPRKNWAIRHAPTTRKGTNFKRASLTVLSASAIQNRGRSGAA